MELHEPTLPHGHQVIINRFVKACRNDERILAALLRGSHATGVADEYSDLDLSLITTDESYDDFVAGREAFVRLLGEPIFLEDFDYPNILFFTFTDGTECELRYGHQSQFDHINLGHYEVLLDKQCLLEGVIFSGRVPTYIEQKETLRRLIYWFWHDLSHFIAALSRGQLWWSYGQLEVLRRKCVDLSRLRENFSAEPEDYEKLDLVYPVERLSNLKTTFCPLEQAAMLRAVLMIVQFYQELVPPLAEAHGVSYPDILDGLLSDRLKKLCNRLLS